MKHRAFTLVEATVVVLIIAVLAAILYPVLAPRPPHNNYRSACMSNLKQLSLGIAQYNNDYDDKFPLIKNTSGGWVELVLPYVKSTQIFHCPTDKTGNAPKTTDYFYNARLSGLEENKLGFEAVTILMGDGLPNQAPDAHLMQLPDAWRKDENSPAWRHLDGAIYSFADGRVKWFKPNKITLDKSSANKPTFLVR